MFKYKRTRRVLGRFGDSTATKPGNRVLTINQTGPIHDYVPTYEKLLWQVNGLELVKLECSSSYDWNICERWCAQ